MSKNTGLVQCCTVTVNLWLTFTYSIHLPRQKMGVGNLENVNPFYIYKLQINIQEHLCGARLPLPLQIGKL